MSKVITSDSKEFLATFKDFEFDIIFADPPYALGSEIIIRQDGKVDYAKASDFMNKWDMPSGEYWEKWFIQAFRTLKHGGWLIMYGMDRQTLLFKYYASLAGFQETQSLYWYFISNFPKSTDLSKMIDKKGASDYGVWFPSFLKQELEKRNMTYKDLATYFPSKTGGLTGCVHNWVEGKNVPTIEQFNKIVEALGLPFKTLDEAKRETIGKGKAGFLENNKTFEIDNEGYGNYDITAPSTDLAKKYDGYKYSVAPLKQTCETIMVFKKPYKTGSCLHDTLAMENGDATITCGALDIDGNRVGTEIMLEGRATQGNSGIYGWNTKNTGKVNAEDDTKEYVGRYPAQTFIDSQIAEKLDLQSGNLPQSDRLYKSGGEETSWFVGTSQDKKQFGDNGGCSKILHKCDYEQIDYDLFIYEPKVDGGERNNGLDGAEPKPSAASEFRPNHTQKALEGQGGNPYGRWKKIQNNHPTVKPIDLNAKILKLFKTPNEQRICYPFAGSGSEIIGGLQADYQNWVACEINQEYTDIANARIKHYQENEHIQLDLFDCL